MLAEFLKHNFRTTWIKVMNKQSNDIDSLLREWGKRQSVDQNHLNRLQRTVTQRAAELPPRRNRPNRLWYKRSVLERHFLAGLAALAAVAVICYFVGMHRIWPAPDPDPVAVAPQAMTLADLRRHTMLFESVQELFDDQWRWVAQSDGDIEMEIHPLPGGVAERSQPVLVRLTILSRKTADKEWHKAWETDVMIRSEEFLDLPLDAAVGNRLQLWVHPLGDGNMVVDTGIALERLSKTKMQACNLLKEGKPAEILAVRGAGSEYRVFQEVMLLTSADG